MPGHALVHAGGVAVLLHRLRLGVGVLQRLAVVGAELRVERRVLVLAQPRQHAEAREDRQRLGRAGRLAQRAVGQQLAVDLRLLGGAEAVRHLDHADAVEERLVVLVGLELLPLGLVGVGDDDALIGHGADVLGADVRAFLRRGQQRVQHLDRRLEHLDELEDALGRAVQPARVAVGVGVVLAQVLELADVELADEARDVLVVLVPGLGLGHADLAQPRGIELHHLELRDVALELLQAPDRPGRHQPGEQPPRDVVLVLEQVAEALAVEEAERRFEDRADLVAGLQDVDRLLLDQLLQDLGERRLAAADRPEQVEDLLALLEPLARVPEEADHPLDRLLGAVEVGEGLVALDRAVEEDPAQPLVMAGVDQLGLADRRHHPFRGGGPHRRVVSTPEQVVLQQHLFDLGPVVGFCIPGEYVHLAQSCSCFRCPAPSLRSATAR